MKRLFFDRKLFQRLFKILGLCFGVVIIISCNFENLKRKKIEHHQCQKELLNIESFIELREKKLSHLEKLIEEIKNQDSLLSLLIFQDTIKKDNSIENVEISKEEMEKYYEKNLRTCPCNKFKEEKNQLKNLLTQIKKIELKCDYYIRIMDKITSKDSLFRKELKLELVPYDMFYKSKFQSDDNIILDLNCTKQLDEKIEKITKQVYYLSRSQNEIFKYSQK